jgi:hypothetical protein
VSNATWLESHASITQREDAAYVDRARTQRATWTEARIASSFAIGWAFALFAYACIQLGMSAGWLSADLASDTIPLFFRWGVSLTAGLLTAAISCVADSHRRMPKLATWTLVASGVATALVVIFAP